MRFMDSFENSTIPFLDQSCPYYLPESIAESLPRNNNPRYLMLQRRWRGRNKAKLSNRRPNSSREGTIKKEMI